MVIFSEAITLENETDNYVINKRQNFYLSNIKYKRKLL